MRKFVVTIEGKQYEVGVEEIGGTSTAPVAVQPAQPAQPAVSAPVAPKAAAPVSGTKMEAPMPGMIKAFKVAEGATVKKGDVILVLEAMKMDNDISAACDGVVSFKTQVGANVNTGDLMAVIG